MSTLLNSVTGNVKNCAPCSWSALTGLSSNTWPDKPMNDYEEWGEHQHHYQSKRFAVAFILKFYVPLLLMAVIPTFIYYGARVAAYAAMLMIVLGLFTIEADVKN